MVRYLERNAYRQFLEWKNNSNHATLEVSGARQVGKTYLVNKFADEQYKRKVYINLLDLSGELFMEKYKALWNEMKNGTHFDNPVHELLIRQQPDFVDSKETIVILDEIQESADIYNRVREFTRELKSDFIITGSYLGRILNKDFKYSSGDLDTLEIQTLNFEEFILALDKKTMYEELDLYGKSDASIYKEMSKLFQIYCSIGGYPAVVLEYIQSGSLQLCQGELLKIIHLFTIESKRYFRDILEDTIYENIFSSIARILAKEKKGLDKNSFSEELQHIVTKNYSSNISKASVKRAIDWLYSCGIIGFAGKVEDCNNIHIKAKSRCFYMDIGLATYFLTKIGCSNSDIAGITSENFVYLDLKRRIIHPAEIALETPAFGTYKNGEIDFFVQSIKSKKIYILEVKSGKNSSKTIDVVKEKNIVDYIVFVKGNTKGGIVDNVYTIPIYGISKFHF